MPDFKDIASRLPEIAGMVIAILTVLGLIGGLSSGELSSENPGQQNITQPDRERPNPAPQPRPSQQPQKPAPRVTAGMRNTEVYRQSQGFERLVNLGKVAPGAKYTVFDQAGRPKGECSFGWMLRQQNTNRVFNLTAGHCGVTGDRAFVMLPNNQLMYAGRFISSTGMPNRIGVDADFAVIFLDNPNVQIDPTVPGVGRVQGVAGLPAIDRTEQKLCRLGWRSGLSCGYYIDTPSPLVFRFRNISDHGDSGGPVWVEGPNGRYAAGVLSFGPKVNATQIGAAAIGPVLEYLSQYNFYYWG